MKNYSINISGRNIGEQYPVFIIAELSANHNQDYNLAIKTIDAMKDSGADAVKIQTFTPDTLTIDCEKDFFKLTQGTLWDGVTLYNLYKKATMPWEWQPKLKKYIEDLGMICFSTPTDKTSADFLEDLGMPAYKIASFEITDIQLRITIDTHRQPDVEIIDVSEYEPKKIPSPPEAGPPLAERTWRECIKKTCLPTGRYGRSIRWSVRTAPEVGALGRGEMSVRPDSGKIISFITEASVIRQILEHLNLWAEKLSRDPPEWFGSPLMTGGGTMMNTALLHI